MKPIWIMYLIPLFCILTMSAYGDRTYGKIEANKNGTLVALPTNTVIVIAVNESPITHKLSKNGWYEVNIPARGKFKVTCVWKGEEYEGFLISTSGPQRFDVRLQRKKD